MRKGCTGSKAAGGERGWSGRCETRVEPAEEERKWEYKGRRRLRRFVNRITCFYEVQKNRIKHPVVIHVLSWNLMYCQDWL